jgi:hypothetical protein
MLCIQGLYNLFTLEFFYFTTTIDIVSRKSHTLTVITAAARVYSANAVTTSVLLITIKVLHVFLQENV